MKTLLTPTPLIAIEIQEHENFVIWGNNLTLWEGDNFKEPILFESNKIECLGTVDKGVIDFYIAKHLISKSPFGIKLFAEWGDEFLKIMQSHSLSLEKKYLIIKPK